MNDLKKELGIDDWLELVKEDKNLNGAYFSFAQYMYILEKQLKQRDEVIDEATKYLDGSFEMATYTNSLTLNGNNIEELYEILTKNKGDKQC